LAPEELHRTVEEIDSQIGERLKRGEAEFFAYQQSRAALGESEAGRTLTLGRTLTRAMPSAFQTSTVTAIDNLELARMSRGAFLEMVLKFPKIRRALIQTALARLLRDRDPDFLENELANQGLNEAKSVLVLDLDRCTRCDECTRGCIQRHGTESHGVPMARMMRDGMRFDKFLVATSCRSCDVPHCMAGCPVDAIHRGKHMQIVIEDHCIGCGLCEANCPYGSITTQPVTILGVESEVRKAVNCDLCDGHDLLPVPTPSCVASCPHDAAFRMTGHELLARARDNVI